MTELFLEEYFKDIAERWPGIAHTNESKAFYRITDPTNLDEFDSAVRNMAKDACLLLEIGDGTIADWDSNRETPRIGLHVLVKTVDDEFAKINAARDLAKTVLLKIVSRMRYDILGKHERPDHADGPLKAGGARFDTKISFSNMSGIDGNWYGKSFYFEFKAPINLEYHAEEWTA
jgi:hypothetical protein